MQLDAFDLVPNNDTTEPSPTDKESALIADFQLLVQIASNSRGNIEGSHVILFL